MTDTLKVGDLTNGFWKASQRPEKITPTPMEDYHISENAIEQLAELARRLGNLEGQITLKADTDRLMSGIVISKDAMLITSDKIGVLGEVSFFDYVRDLNGQATGDIDPSMTLIRGGVIATERITSHVVDELQGSFWDLDDGTMVMGGTADPRFKFSNDPVSNVSTLEISGNVTVKDRIDNEGAVDLGYFSTGTAAYNNDTKQISGTGVLVGTPGIYGVENGVPTFGFDVFTGNAYFAGDVDTQGYVYANGNQSTGFTVDISGDGNLYDIMASSMGNNITDPVGVKDLYTGVTGRVKGNLLGTPGSASYSAAVFGYNGNESGSESGTADAPLRYGVFGFGANDFAAGVNGYSENSFGVWGVSKNYTGGKFTHTANNGGVGVSAKGTVGILAQTFNEASSYAIRSEGAVQITTGIEKLDQSFGHLEIYNQDGTPHLVDQGGATGLSNVLQFRFTVT